MKIKLWGRNERLNQASRGRVSVIGMVLKSVATARCGSLSLRFVFCSILFFI